MEPLKAPDVYGKETLHLNVMRFIQWMSTAFLTVSLEEVFHLLLWVFPCLLHLLQEYRAIVEYKFHLPLISLQAMLLFSEMGQRLKQESLFLIRGTILLSVPWVFTANKLYPRTEIFKQDWYRYPINLNSFFLTNFLLLFHCVSMKELFMPESFSAVKKEREKARQLKKTSWWRDKLKRGLCYYCEKSFSQNNLTMDHIVPLVRGGKTGKNNVVVSCRPCNSKKSSQTLVELKLKKD